MGLIYLDTNILIYVCEDESEYGESLRIKMADESLRMAISPLTMMECLVKPIKSGNAVLQRRYEEWFDRWTQLSMPASVYVDAAVLRAHFGLKTPDALHLACAQHHGCEALWTNDDRLSKAAHGLAVNILV